METLKPTLEHIEKRFAQLPIEKRQARSPDELRRLDEEEQWLHDQREIISPPTEEVVEYCIHMIAVNWRRTKDAEFFNTSFPTYWEAFKHLNNNLLRKAINQFLIECTDKFQPPFGVIQKFVTNFVGERESKEKRSVSDCPDCETGQRYTSVLWKGDNGRYKMRTAYVSCGCTAGNQRRRNLGSNHEGNMMTTLEEWEAATKNNHRIIQTWCTSRDMRELPWPAMEAGNPLICKQIEEDNINRRKKTGLGQVYAERMKSLRRRRQ